MSNFDKEALANLERLSKIKLTETEEVEFVQALKQIIDYIEQLNQVDTKDIKSCNYVLLEMQQNVMREDDAKNTITREKFLENSPDQISGMVKVPPVINQQ